MRNPNQLVPCLLLLAFTSLVYAGENEKNAGQIETILLSMCSDPTIGYRIKCDPDWILMEEPNSAIMIIKDEMDLSVIATISKSNEKNVTLKALTPDKLRFLGQYGNDIRIDRTQIAGLDAIKVRAKALDIAEMELLDYYIVKDQQLYSILFSVNPSNRFEDFRELFDAMVQSLELINK